MGPGIRTRRPEPYRAQGPGELGRRTFALISRLIPPNAHRAHRRLDAANRRNETYRLAGNSVVDPRDSLDEYHLRIEHQRRKANSNFFSAAVGPRQICVCGNSATGRLVRAPPPRNQRRARSVRTHCVFAPGPAPLPSTARMPTALLVHRGGGEGGQYHVHTTNANQRGQHHHPNNRTRHWLVIPAHQCDPTVRHTVPQRADRHHRSKQHANQRPHVQINTVSLARKHQPPQYVTIKHTHSTTNRKEIQTPTSQNSTSNSAHATRESNRQN